MRTPTALLAVALLLAPALRAQKAVPEPTRPHLDPGADTNDAGAYYRYGARMIESKPEESSRAFYWASKLDPASAEALYAMRTAALMRLSSSDLYDYYDYWAKKRKPQYLALDSLLYRAYAINPFLYRNLDRSLNRRTLEADYKNDHPDADAASLNVAILEYMHDQRHSAWASYAQGRLPEALDAYAKELKELERTKNKRNKRDHEDDASTIHAERSRIFYLLGNMDSAFTEMTAAMAGQRERDAKETVILYESKAVYEQSLGMIQEKAQHPDLAREAYAHALEEDLSYFSAHMKMASLQLGQGDTASAVTEIDLAVQLQPNDPALRYDYAVVLVQARRDADAVNQLMKSIAIDPYYAAPRLLLARIADAEQYTDDAVREYKEYVALAPKSDPQAEAARSRLTALAAAPAPAPAAAKP